MTNHSPRIDSKPFIAIVTALLLVLAAGCGGGGGEPEALTKAEFIKRGDAICRNTDKRQSVVLREYLKAHPGGISRTEKAQEEAVQALGIPPLKEEAEELAALEPPKGQEAQVRPIVAGLEKVVKAMEQNPAVALGSGEKLFAAIDKAAQEYGFKDCSEVL